MANQTLISQYAVPASSFKDQTSFDDDMSKQDFGSRLKVGKRKQYSVYGDIYSISK